MSITVVIPTHQTPESVLARALASALACPKVEQVLVIDDGSRPPATLPLIPPSTSLGTSSGTDSVGDQRVQLVRQPNAGPAAARNTGLMLVRSEWALLLDDDDELIPEGIAEAHALAVQLQAVAAVVGRVEVTHPAPASHNGSTRTPASASPQAGAHPKQLPAPPEWAGHPLPRPADVFRPITLFNASGTLIARRVLDAGILYDTTLRIGEDREFLRRVADLGPIAVGPAIAVRASTNARADRLTSDSHLDRRAWDHLAIMNRWLDAESEPHFREATRWLLNAMSKRVRARHSSDDNSGGGDERGGGVHPLDNPVSNTPTGRDPYLALLALARERHWLTLGQELKLGLRHALRGVMA